MYKVATLGKRGCMVHIVGESSDLDADP